MGAGGLEKNAQYSNCTGGAARIVDVSLFGSDHIYQRPTPRVIYNTALAFDPEGLFSFRSHVKFSAHWHVSRNGGESVFSSCFLYSNLTFRGTWRVNLCVVCLFGSRSRKSASGFPGKQSTNISLVNMVARHGKKQRKNQILL